MSNIYKILATEFRPKKTKVPSVFFAASDLSGSLDQMGLSGFHWDDGRDLSHCMGYFIQSL